MARPQESELVAVGAPAETAAARPMWIPIVLGALAVAIMAVVLQDTTRLVGRSFPGFLVWDNGIVAAFFGADWTGGIAEVPPNARVLSVNGEAFQGGTWLLELAAERPPGSPLEYRLKTGDGELTLTVNTMRLDWAGYGSTFGIYLLNAAVLFFVAVVAVFLRPDRTAARALALAAGVVGGVLALSLDFLTAYRSLYVYLVLEALAPGTIAYFALCFPVERITSRYRLTTLLCLLAPLVALGLAQVALFRSNPELAFGLNDVVYALIAAGFIGLIASLGYALLSAPTPEQRMDVGVVLAGASVLLAPILLMSALPLLEWSISYTWIVAFVAVLPLSVLYAVVQRDLLQSEKFIRLTVSYSVSTSALVLAYAFGLLFFDRLLGAGIAAHPAAPFGVVVVLAVGLDPARARVQKAIDRAFFRSSVDVATTLQETGAKLTALPDEGRVARAVEEELCESLALEWAQVTTTEVARVDAEIVETIRFREERLGELACGPKRSGAPFSAAERELVASIARQTALAIQNARAIEALRAAQAALLQAERLAAIGEVAGAVAHGLRNPLAGIRAAAQLAQRQATDPDNVEILGDVLSEVDRLEARVRTLLDFSRPFEPKFQDVDVSELVRLVAQGAESRLAALEIEADVDAPDAGPIARSDPNLLEEVLQELVANAIRAMEGRGGTLGLKLETRDDRVAFEISDTGHGIPEAVRGRVFDLFFTTRPAGTGMGLAMAKKVLSRLGGDIELVRSDDRGTTFRVEIPQNGLPDG